MAQFIDIEQLASAPAAPPPGKVRVYALSDGQLHTLDQDSANHGVTSVGLTAPTEFTVSGSPVTEAGTLAITKATQLANKSWSGPATGAAAAPTFRSLVNADVPNLAELTGGGATTLHSHAGGSGTVTSVALTAPADLTVSGSPVTTTGTLAITRATQTANKVLASAVSGGAAVPAYRALVAADIPASVNSGIQYVDVQLTDAQIKALPTTPITLIAAPGAGFALRPHASVGSNEMIALFSWTADYTNLNANAVFVLSIGASGPIASIQPYNSIGGDFLATGHSVLWCISSADISFSHNVYMAQLANVDNQPLLLTMDNASDGVLTGGDPANKLSIRIWYTVIPTVAFGS